MCGYGLGPDGVCASSEKGYFMHFSTASFEPGDQAFLETQWLYPKPGTHCLQFFLHQSGASDDVLNIWVRDYNKDDLGEQLTLFRSITGMHVDMVLILSSTVNHNSILEVHMIVSTIHLYIYIGIVLFSRDFAFTVTMWKGQEIST